VVATAAQGIGNYAWSPDGRRGAALISARLVSIEAGKSSRALADGISSVAFAADGQTVYAVRVTAQGTNDRAEVLQINYASGSQRSIGSVSYAHPQIVAETPVKDAQFADDGGAVRVYALSDGRIGLWVLGAGAYIVDPTTGQSSKVANQPRLFSPDQKRRVELVAGAQDTTTLILRDQADKATSTTVAQGLVSHVRWSPNGSEVVFTLGIASGGGVRQDLYIWDLTANKAPAVLTNNGATFGAEWLGTSQSWVP
jgi:WD40 repeat protein